MKEKYVLDYLYHYYEKQNGPFRNLSDLPIEQAQRVLDRIRSQDEVFAAKRHAGYLERRRELEQVAREQFISKGGKPQRKAPHYMIVGACKWLQTWYRVGQFVKVPVTEFSTDVISFSYGDLFPTFSPRVTDNKEYRGKIYTYEEIVELINRYGLPQEWNADGQYGPERYIEVQVWTDQVVKDIVKQWTLGNCIAKEMEA